MQSSRKRLALAIAALVGSAAAPSAAQAQCGAAYGDFGVTNVAGYFAFVRLNAQVFNLSCLLSTDGFGNVNAVGGLTVSNTLLSINTTFRPDPLNPNMSFGTSVTPNAPGTVDVAFVFVAPLAPLVYAQASASADFGLSRAAGSATVTLRKVANPSTATAATAGALGQSNVPSYLTASTAAVGVFAADAFTTDLGVDIAGGTCAIASSPTGSRSNNCAAIDQAGLLNPAQFGGLASYGVKVSYRVTSTGTNTSALNAQVNGGVSLSAVVPEPGTVVLTATGLLTLVGTTLRRRRGQG
jgi:hypothetical protein